MIQNLVSFAQSVGAEQLGSMSNLADEGQVPYSSRPLHGESGGGAQPCSELHHVPLVSLLTQLPPSVDREGKGSLPYCVDRAIQPTSTQGVAAERGAQMVRSNGAAWPWEHSAAVGARETGS